MSVPKELLKKGKTDNRIAIETKEAPAADDEAGLDNIGGGDDGKSKSLRIQYSVIKCRADVPCP